MIFNLYFPGSDQLQQEPGVENSISTLATAIADRKNTDRKNSETLSQVGDNSIYPSRIISPMYHRIKFGILL